MKCVLDASVAIAALRKKESGHVAALRRCLPIFSGQDQIVVPAIFDIEVSAALVRRGVEPSSVARFLDEQLTSRELVTIGPRAVRAVQAIVSRTHLRAADALYVWVAAREGLALVTIDREILTLAERAGVTAIPP